ncbi:hypothetical protein BJY01DRAFT_253121 [Aspergillus pseudoustus]|uniref:AMP-dependent synthetase/ligase domain-containing protein n=1 Tax=Aspergillus pseudoustus TaxID=1810923 RepID=A0ABR4J2G6_9EURO
MTAVPTILSMLCKQPIPERFNIRAIETVVSGSAPLTPDIARLIEKQYLRPDVKIRQGWGMTETTCSIAGFAPDDEDDGRSVGWLNPNCAARIVPVEDREFGDTAPAGITVGEIWVAGPNIMKGYYKNPHGTAETIIEADGYRWLKTGDIGYIDRRGRVFIVDRLKVPTTVFLYCGALSDAGLTCQELIKVKGLQVAPAELELFLITHPDIADAAVAGAKISDGDEYPRAFIVRKKGTVGEKEVFNLIKDNFARHKWLTGGVYFISAIPRTGSGKVIRRQLPVPVETSTPLSKL